MCNQFWVFGFHTRSGQPRYMDYGRNGAGVVSVRRRQAPLRIRNIEMGHLQHRTRIKMSKLVSGLSHTLPPRGNISMMMLLMIFFLGQWSLGSWQMMPLLQAAALRHWGARGYSARNHDDSVAATSTFTWPSLIISPLSFSLSLPQILGKKWTRADHFGPTNYAKTFEHNEPPCSAPDLQHFAGQ